MKNIFNLIVVYYLWGKKVFSFEALELCTLFNLSPAAKQQQHPCDFSWIRYSDGPIFHFASRLIAFLERVFREFGCFPQLSSFCHSRSRCTSLLIRSFVRSAGWVRLMFCKSKSWKMTARFFRIPFFTWMAVELRRRHHFSTQEK